MIPRILMAAVAFAVLAACSKEEARVAPPAHSLTADATGRYCGMLLAEHAGPKGQALLRGRSEPVWFSSARDALIFLRMPEEPRDVAAVYVTDMARTRSWDHPDPGAWVEVEQAWFVIDSDRRGGMGGAEAVPFSREDAARAFQGQHGGRVVRLAEVPDAYLFDPGAPDEPEGGHAAH